MRMDLSFRLLPAHARLVTIPVAEVEPTTHTVV